MAPTLIRDLGTELTTPTGTEWIAADPASGDGPQKLSLYNARKWFEPDIHLHDYGDSLGDGNTTATSAFVSAIADAAALGTTTGNNLTGNPRTITVAVDPGVYMVNLNQIILPPRVLLVGSPAQGCLPARWPQAVLKAIATETTGAVVQTTVGVDVSGSGVIGLGFAGNGSTGTITGVKFNQGGGNCVVECRFDQFSDHAIRVVAAETGYFARNVATNCLLNRTRAAKTGVLHLEATTSDCWIVGGEYNAGGLATITDSNLRCCSVYVNGAAHFVSDVVGEFGDVGIHYAGSLGKFTSCRADLNAGHGFEIAGSSSQIIGCHAHHNSQTTTNTHDGFNVTGPNNIFTGCHVSDTGGAVQHRYAFRDTASGDSNKNRWLGCFGQRAATAIWDTEPFSGAEVLFPDGPPKSITSGTTPNVAQTKFIDLGYSSATTITNFTGGVSGQRLLIRSGNGNATIQHNGTTIFNQSGTNLTLAANKPVEYVLWNGWWFQVAGAASTSALNVKDFGAKGDGTANDTAAIQAAVAAMTAKSTLYFPAGSYRVTTANPAGDAPIYLNGLSDVGVIFAPGAELLMDNLTSAGANGGGHGIHVKGACSNVRLDGVRIRWAAAPTNRSFGDGIRVMGYPSDSAPAGGWLGSTGTVSNISLINCSVFNAPQTGAVLHGCSDVFVTNFRAQSTKADGLHFNACRRIALNGHKAVSTGDDGLAFVTYYHATNVWEDATQGPFNRPALDDWSNSGSATTISSKSTLANGVRLAGVYGLALSDIYASSCSSCGVVLTADIANGTTIFYTALASRNLKVSGAVIDGCSSGVLVSTGNITSADGSQYWRFGAIFTDITVENCSNWSVRTNGNGSTATSILSGITFDNVRADTTAGNGVGFSSLRDSTVTNVTQRTTNGANIGFFGQDVALSGALTTLPVSNVTLDNIVNIGGGILFQDLRGASVGRLRSVNATASGVTVTQAMDLQVVSLQAAYPHRGNTGTSRGVLLAKTRNVQILSAAVDHDANATGTWRSLEIGGGDATDPAARDLRVNEFVYRNTRNQAGSDIVVQGGADGPVNYLYDARWYNGGEGTPIWRNERWGSTPNVAERFVITGFAAEGNIVAGIGSTCTRKDGSTGTTLLVKEANNTTANGWVAHATATGLTLTAMIAARSGVLVAETPLTTKTPRWYNRLGRTIVVTAVHVSVDTAPTGSGVTVAVRKNGGGSNDASATIAASAFTASATGLSLSLADGDYLQAWTTAVGSTVAGTDLAVTVVGS